MKPFILLADFHTSLLERLSGKEVIFSTDDISQAVGIQQASQNAGIRLRAIRAKGPSNLSDLQPDFKWQDVPIALEVGGIGRFRDLVKIREALLRSNIRIYLPARSRANCVEIRILSSLGLSCCALFAGAEGQTIDWEALKDLAIYSIHARRPHGEIDPFSFILGHYHASGLTDFRTVYFDDPSIFLHVSEDGRLSLSAEGIHKGSYLSIEIEDSNKVRELDEYWSATREWKTFFVERTRCSQCKAWRICAGALAWSGPQSGCDLVLQEVLDGAEHWQQAQNRVKQLWRL
jgi:hypothetical protein